MKPGKINSNFLPNICGYLFIRNKSELVTSSLDNDSSLTKKLTTANLANNNHQLLRLLQVHYVDNLFDIPLLIFESQTVCNSIIQAYKPTNQHPIVVYPLVEG